MSFSTLFVVLTLTHFLSPFSCVCSHAVVVARFVDLLAGLPAALSARSVASRAALTRSLARSTPTSATAPMTSSSCPSSPQSTSASLCCFYRASLASLSAFLISAAMSVGVYRRLVVQEHKDATIDVGADCCRLRLPGHLSSHRPLGVVDRA